MGRSEEQKNNDSSDSFDTPAHPTDDSSSKEGGFVCCFCSVTFVSLAALKTHIPEHGEEAKLYGCRTCPSRFHFKEDLDEHVVQQHVTKEVIKREQEDSDDEVDNGGNEDGLSVDMNDQDGGNGEQEESGGSEQGDSIVNVESEIKIDNDSYATVFYCRYNNNNSIIT